MCPACCCCNVLHAAAGTKCLQKHQARPLNPSPLPASEEEACNARSHVASTAESSATDDATEDAADEAPIDDAPADEASVAFFVEAPPAEVDTAVLSTALSPAEEATLFDLGPFFPLAPFMRNDLSLSGKGRRPQGRALLVGSGQRGARRGGGLPASSAASLLLACR